MKQYFIFNDNKINGPVTADQLSQHGLNPNSLVWCSDNWVPASQVAELKPYLEKTTTQYPPQQSVAMLPPIPYSAPMPQYQQSARLNLSSQKFFKFVLLGFLAYLSIASLNNFIDSFTFFNKWLKLASGFTGESYFLFGLLLMLSSLTAIVTSIVIITRIINKKSFAFLSLVFFATTFLLAILDMMFICANSIFFSLMVAGVLGLGATFFAARRPSYGLNSLMTERTTGDLILVGFYAVLMIALLIVGATSKYIGFIIDDLYIARCPEIIYVLQHKMVIR